MKLSENGVGCFLLRMDAPTLEVFKNRQNNQCEECCKEDSQIRWRFDPINSAVFYNPEGLWLKHINELTY